MINKFYISFFLVMATFKTYAQVESTTYNLMLKALLKHDVKEISVKELKELDNQKIVILDARSIDEYNVSHIKGAIWVGYDNFKLKTIDKLSKESNIIIYCSVGYRSEKIGEKLMKDGFSNLSNLYGGIFEWVNEGNTVVDNNNQPTKKVHAYSKSWGIWLNKGEKVYPPN